MINQVNGLIQSTVGMLTIMVAAWIESVEMAILGAVVAIIGGFHLFTSQIVDAIRELKREVQTEESESQSQVTK